MISTTHLVRSAAVAACLIGALACEKTEAPSTPAPAEPVPANVEAPTAITAAIQVDMETVPAEEDFEDEAEAAITPANLEKQLDAMEKEILAD
jgi:hypothetical protein